MKKCSVRLALLASLALAHASTQAQPGTSYLCVPDQLIGYKADAGGAQWASTTFTTDEKIIVNKVSEQPSKFELRKLGSTLPPLQCRTMAEQSLHCDGLGTQYLINLKSLRYMSVYANGYWNDDADNFLLKPGANTPSMGIGRCTSI